MHCTISCLSLSLSLRFNGHFPDEPALVGCLLKQRMMEVVVTTGLLELQVMQSSSQIITTNKPTSSFFTGGCPSCRPTNSVKALKQKISHPMDLLTPSLPGGLPTLPDH